jgi:hypothetical protein
MDLETRTVNGVMEVIMLTAFDGKDLFTFWTDNYNSPEEMLKEAVNIYD